MLKAKAQAKAMVSRPRLIIKILALKTLYSWSTVSWLLVTCFSSV